MTSETTQIHELLIISKCPPSPGDVRLGRGFDVTLAKEPDQDQIREWGAAAFGSFVTRAIEARQVSQIDQVYEIATAAFDEARQSEGFNPAAMETFLQGVLHGGIIVLDPNRSLLTEAK